MNNINTLTGTGLVFPFRIERGSLVLETGLDLLKSCIQNLFRFEFGTRYFFYEFGLELETHLEEPNDDVLIKLVEYRLLQQINEFDDRIRLSEMRLNRISDTKLEIILTIGITNTKIETTVTLPYNLEL
jgi:phage baseplate assembly protein W